MAEWMVVGEAPGTHPSRPALIKGGSRRLLPSLIHGGRWGEPSSPRGFTLLEMAGAMVVLTVVMVLTLQLVTWIAAERRGAARRQWALYEADRVLERVVSLPWDELSDQHLASLPLAERTGRELPDGRLRVEVVPTAGGPELKRVRVEIRWTGRNGVEEAPVRLATWVARTAREARP